MSLRAPSGVGFWLVPFSFRKKYRRDPPGRSFGLEASQLSTTKRCHAPSLNRATAIISDVFSPSGRMCTSVKSWCIDRHAGAGVFSAREDEVLLVWQIDAASSAFCRTARQHSAVWPGRECRQYRHSACGPAGGVVPGPKQPCQLRHQI